MFHRFVAPFLLELFASIDRSVIDDNSKKYHRRRNWNRGGGYSYKPNGRQECERRVVQVVAGRLTVANGLQS